MKTSTKLAIAWLAVGVTACGDDQPAARPKTITINADPPPALLAFRHEDEADWRVIPVDGKTKFEITAHGPYRVVVACEEVFDERLTFAAISAYARTLDDDGPLEDLCAPLAPHRVTGSVDDPLGAITFGRSTAWGSDPNWTFDVGAAPGVHDLAILRGSIDRDFDEIAIRRDVAVTGDLDLGEIKLADAKLQPMSTVTFAPRNALPNEQLFMDASLFLTNTLVTLSPSDPSQWTTALPPAALLRETDRHNVVLSASTPRSTTLPFLRSYRDVTFDFVPSMSTSIELPPPLGTASFERTPSAITATWPSLPDHTSVTLLRIGPFMDGMLVIHQLDATRSFFEATDPTSLTLDLGDIPGFKPSWQLDPAEQETSELTAVNVRGPFRLSSTISENTLPRPATPGFAAVTDELRRRAGGGGLSTQSDRLTRFGTSGDFSQQK